MLGINVFANEWKQDEIGWWYQNDDGSYPRNEWCWIVTGDGKTANCYYFNDYGYAAINTVTPDGYLVNENGAWIKNGVVQIKNLEIKGADTPILNKEEIEEAKAEAREEAIEKAKDKLYDAEGRGRSKRQKAVQTYFKALGYDISGLTFIKNGYKYLAGFAGVGDPFYRLLKDDSNDIAYYISYYLAGDSDDGADCLIESVEEYLD